MFNLNSVMSSQVNNDHIYLIELNYTDGFITTSNINVYAAINHLINRRYLSFNEIKTIYEINDHDHITKLTDDLYPGLNMERIIK